jgi:class 3 adenylate cyclase/tetratricopeptide (TPR) repeat protein
MYRCSVCGHVTSEPFKFCPECGTPTAVTAAREERKTVTVLFCDLVGSTELGERLDPESLRRVLARYFDTVRTVIERHGGSVEKFIGDAVMAVFGVPVLHEDDALRAVRAAAGLREALGPLNAGLERDYGAALSVRIGINTGEVVTGTEERLATGDAVNVAARLEQHAGAGEILLGEATLELVRGAVDVEPLDALELKGKRDPVRAWRLRDVQAEQARRLSSVRMVGREEETRRLEDAFTSSVETFSCRRVTVVGDAGVGKSRLVWEFLDGLRGAVILRGRCLPYGDGITYWPVAEIVQQLEDQLERLAPDPRMQRALRGLLGGEPAVSSTEEIAWAVRKLLEAAAVEQPVVCVLDDVHWGEETFLDLVEQVTTLTREVPLFLICMSRPELLERRPGWGGAIANATTVLLKPLSDEQAERLIDELAGDDPLDPQLRDRIRSGAEGNPLFVEEMIELLRNATDGDVSVPATIQALLASRLDQLEPAERTVLECAAVAGRVFHNDELEALVPEPVLRQLGTVLAALVRKDLIRADPDRLLLEDEAYRFRHELIRDAAYEALPKSARAELHERLADRLDADEIVGYHLEQAFLCRRDLTPGTIVAGPLATRAAERLAAAGSRALARLDAGAARTLLERALSLCADDDPAVSLRLDLAEALFLSGDAGAAAVAAGAADRAGAADDRSGRLRAQLMGARITVLTASDETAGVDTSSALLALAAEARPVFSANGDDAAMTEAWVATAWAELIRCRYGDMLEAVEHAIEHAERAQYARWQRELPVWQGSAMFYGPVPADDILRWHERERPTHALTFRQRGMLEAMQGRFDVARTLIDQGDAAADELGQTIWLVVGGMARWDVEMLAGAVDAAERAIRATCQKLEELGDTGYRATATAQLAESLFARDRFEEAERRSQVAEELAAPDDRVSQALWRQVRAKLLARAGAPTDAERLAREAVALLDETDMLDYHARAVADLATVLRAVGQPEEASNELARAIELFEAKGNVVRAERARAAQLELPLERR